MFTNGQRVKHRSSGRLGTFDRPLDREVGDPLVIYTLDDDEPEGQTRPIAIRLSELERHAVH